MATTYQWCVTMLECIPNDNGLEKIVQTIRWRLSGDDGVNYAEIHNAIGITPPDPNQFVQYSSLTEEQVLSWLTDTLGEHGVAEAMASVDSRLADLANPPVITPELPWNITPAE